MSEAGVTAKELLRRQSSPAFRPIPTFLQGLDTALAGGIKPGLLTEVIGHSGVGKTTFCIQLCMDVQIPQSLQGPEAEALFIDTENTFVASRVKEMAQGFVTHCNYVIGKQRGRKLSVEGVMNGIHVVKCKNVSEFDKIVLSLEKFLKENRKVRLVVIDSIAFPSCAKEEGFSGRSQSLYSIGQVLHYLAGAYDVAIVITNTLTTRFHSNGGEYFVPFLGESWYYIPNQQIALSWKGRVRRAQIVMSSCEPTSTAAEVFYKVAGVGIRE